MANFWLEWNGKLIMLIAVPKSKAAAPAAAASSWLVALVANPTFIGWAFGTVSAIYAVFQAKSATKSQLMLRAAIVGVEHATQLPEVQAVEQKIKGSIQKFAAANGVESELSALVQDITGALLPAPAATPAPTPAAT